MKIKPSKVSTMTCGEFLMAFLPNYALGDVMLLALYEGN
jgi:hypothetical protein